MRIKKLVFDDYARYCLPLIKKTMPKEVYEDAVSVLLGPKYLNSRILYGIKIKDPKTGRERLVSFSGWILFDRKFNVSWTATDPEFQGCGFCSRILKLVFNKIKSMGAKSIVVETYEHPKFYSALVFYRKLGFKLYAFLPNYLMDGSLIFYMKKNL